MNEFRKYYILIIFLIVALLVYWIIGTTPIKKSNEYNDFIIDPDNFKKVHVCSNRGKQLMRMYMRCYFQDFLVNTQNDWNYILPTELHKQDLSKYYLLDVRKPEDYKNGHIPGAVNIFWKELMISTNIDRLPKDKDIIIICYLGHTASQVLVMLKLLGYKARVLKFGMGESPTVGIPVAGWKNYGYPVQK